MRIVARPHEFRDRTEELERASLSTWATLSTETKGRDRHEDADAHRTVFQVDLDRILSCAAFRALAGKRAWLPVTVGPTRMQQAVLVARLAGLVARAVRVNEDLVTAIAYGHALGATPFAAAGEEALSPFLDGAYDVAEQSVWIVEHVERDRAGLNLTWETRDGMLHHDWQGQPPASVEGQAVRAMARVVGVAWPVVEALRGGRLRADDVRAAIRHRICSPDGLAGVAYGVALASVDAPEIALGADVEEILAELAEIATSLAERDDAVADRHRSVHCLRSLVVYEAERHVSPDGTVALTAALDGVALATEAEILTRFRAAFEPSVVAADPPE
jgi:dGTPase